ncbi:MAG: DUF4160 domain-containing protein [Actinobacteria bacterium]|nr:DUF4160 domain-containing protein [Actinomycetota bacterium]
MPRVSAFYGIVIEMYFDEAHHAGRPHFHAKYAGVSASYDIETLRPIVGRLPRRSHRLVVKWARLHQEELLQDWARCRTDRPLLPIDPLP